MDGGKGQEPVHALVRRRFADEQHQVAPQQDGGNPHPPQAGQVQMQGPAGSGQRDVGCHDERLGHGARLSFPQSYRQGALSGGLVFFPVPDVVDGDHDGAEQAALDSQNDSGVVHRQRVHQRAGDYRGRAYLHQNGAQDGHQPEEEDNECFSQSLVCQRPRAARIAVGEVEGGNADGDDGPPPQFNEGKGQKACRRQEQAAEEHDRPVGQRSAGRHADGAGAAFRVRVFRVVNGVVEEIAGYLDAQAGSEGQQRQTHVPVARQFLHDHAARPYRNQGCGERFWACRQKSGSNDVHERAGKESPVLSENGAEVAEGFLEEGDMPLAGSRLLVPQVAVYQAGAQLGVKQAGDGAHRSHAHHGDGAFRLFEKLHSSLNVARDAGGEGEFDDVGPVGAGLLFLFTQVVHARRDLKVMGGADDEDAAVGGFHDQFPAVAHGLDFNVDGRGARHVGAEQGEALFFRNAAQAAFFMAADGDQQRHFRPEFHDLFRRKLRGQRVHAQFHPVALVFQILAFKRFPDLPGGDGRHYFGRIGLMFT